MELNEKHIENTKLIANRAQLLEHFPKNAVVAEIGVAEGKYSEKILSTTKPKELHLIDIWDSERFGETAMLAVRDKFKEPIDAGRVAVHRGHSLEVLQGFEDGYFDWVYLDTSHRYRDTLDELECCWLKVRDGGLIAGHDYASGNIESGLPYGVVEAVNEFCNTHDWRLAYLTNEARRYLSFAITHTTA